MDKFVKFIYSAIIIAFASVIVFLIADIKFALIVLFLALLIDAYRIYKEKVGQELVVAFLFALIVTSYWIYEYAGNNFIIGRINLFPLISWTTGLVLLREIYERVLNKNFIKTIVFYLISLFAVEYIGYWILNIHLNTNYPSLFNLGIIHASLGLKLFYLLAGPIYILITDYLKVK
jgi:hypothetical protein